LRWRVTRVQLPCAGPDVVAHPTLGAAWVFSRTGSILSVTLPTPGRPMFSHT